MRGERRVFHGQSLRIARLFNSLTQAELANRVECSQVYIAKLEKDVATPNDVMATALADALGVAQSFFARPLPDEFLDEECHFRKRRTTAAQVKNRALAHGTMLFAVVDFIEQYVELPSVNIPELRASDEAQIERTAEKCRVHWGLGLDGPIRNVVRAAENAGVVVTRFGGASSKVDAFSRGGLRPVIVLSTLKNSPSRSRFDVAHELGHLVMHGGMDTGDTDTEDQANRFASAFLLPRIGFLREFPIMRSIDWAVVWRLKARWRVSAAAIVRRAYDLGRISAYEYRGANIYLRKEGYPEPHDDFAADDPELLRDALDTLREGMGMGGKEIADMVGVPTTVLAELLNVPVEEAEPASDPEGATLVPFRMRRSDK